MAEQTWLDEIHKLKDNVNKLDKEIDAFMENEQYEIGTDEHRAKVREFKRRRDELYSELNRLQNNMY